jgi:hypothetical protein
MRENLTYGLKWQGMETRAVRHSRRHLLTLHGAVGLQPEETALPSSLKVGEIRPCRGDQLGDAFEQVLALK